jgi:hypothetical protein
MAIFESIIGKPKESKSNWINGENLDKIKFPCFCEFAYEGKKHLGQINFTFHKEFCYQLADIEKQCKGVNVYRQTNTLKELIEEHDIHIRKGKILIFEEEK